MDIPERVLSFFLSFFLYFLNTFVKTGCKPQEKHQRRQIWPYYHRTVAFSANNDTKRIDSCNEHINLTGTVGQVCVLPTGIATLYFTLNIALSITASLGNILILKVRSDHRSEFSNLCNWKLEA